MDEQKTLDRREFTLAAVLAALSGVAITVSACGGSSYSSPTSPSAGTGSGGGTASGDKEGTISANHGHRAVVTSAQLTAGSAVNLDIQYQADHPHSVQLTAGEISAIAAGQRVSRESSSNSGHSHTVTFN